MEKKRFVVTLVDITSCHSHASFTHNSDFRIVALPERARRASGKGSVQLATAMFRFYLSLILVLVAFDLNSLIKAARVQAPLFFHASRTSDDCVPTQVPARHDCHVRTA
jgi:hypothetical protein